MLVCLILLEVPPPDFTPSFAKILPELRWERKENYEIPYLIFRCSFETYGSIDLYYSVFFYVDGVLIEPVVLVKGSKAEDAYITDKDNSEIKLGITVLKQIDSF